MGGLHIGNKGGGGNRGGGALHREQGGQGTGVEGGIASSNV